MINIIYKLTNLYLNLINLIIKKKSFCKKVKKDHLLSQSEEKRFTTNIRHFSKMTEFISFKLRFIRKTQHKIDKYNKYSI